MEVTSIKATIVPSEVGHGISCTFMSLSIATKFLSQIKATNIYLEWQIGAGEKNETLFIQADWVHGYCVVDVLAVVKQ